MKTENTVHQKGYALVMVMVFMGAGALILAGALSWSSQSAQTTERSNQYFSTVAAAEAATEKILTRISSDFRSGGESRVYNNMDAYSALIPTEADGNYFTNFIFSNGRGSRYQTFVSRMAPTSYVLLNSQYAGLRGNAATYRVVSNAELDNGRNRIAAGVGQDVQVASIPIFQFAIFYTLDLEINPGPDMTINGRVHSNGNLYTEPQANLTFLADVTAAGDIIPNKKPGDPLVRRMGTVNFGSDHDGGLSSMNLPIGTNNSPDAIHQIVEIPPTTEIVSSAMGKERYFNKTDMIIIVSNTTTTVTSGVGINNRSTVLTSNEWRSFMSTTNAPFYNQREFSNVRPIEIDVAKLKTWTENTTNKLWTPLGNRPVSSIYVSDQRTGAGVQRGLKIKNGQTLPARGLTIATPDPIYIQGDYNVSDGTTRLVGSTNTLYTRPASLVGDAITILSTNWVDSRSDDPLSNRTAGPTTVNAALLGGIVPTGNGSYSGGVENFTRFLENWGNKTFTYNGSMVVMFDSRVAISPWGMGGVYSPPARNWTFDNNFLDPLRLPPCTPQITALIRGTWASLRAGTVIF